MSTPVASVEVEFADGSTRSIRYDMMRWRKLGLYLVRQIGMGTMDALQKAPEIAVPAALWIGLGGSGSSEQDVVKMMDLRRFEYYVGRVMEAFRAAGLGDDEDQAGKQTTELE